VFERKPLFCEISKVLSNFTGVGAQSNSKLKRGWQREKAFPLI
jgi:hypothetical protein